MVEKKSMGSFNKELDAFFPDHKFTLVDGDEIGLPKMSWGRELKLVKIVLRIFKGVDLTKLGESGASSLLSSLPTMLETAGPAATEFCSIMLDKDETWIDNNLDMTDVIDLITSFFVVFFRTFSEQTKKISEGLNKLNPEEMEDLTKKMEGSLQTQPIS